MIRANLAFIFNINSCLLVGQINVATKIHARFFSLNAKNFYNTDDCFGVFNFQLLNLIYHNKTNNTQNSYS